MIELLPAIIQMFSQTGAAGVAQAGGEAAAATGAGESAGGFLDNLTNTIMGQADADLTPEQMGNRRQRRSQASAMAGQAAENPGEGFMDIPNAGGGGFGLQDIVSLFMKK